MNSIISAYDWALGVVHTVAMGISKGDPMVLGLASLGIIGFLIKVSKGIPTKIWKFVKGRTMVSVQVDNSWLYDNRDVFQALCDFISEHQVNRSVMLVKARVSTKGNGKVSVDLRTGPHRPSTGLFFIGWRPFWFTFQAAKEMGSVPENVTLTTLGRKTSTIWDSVNLIDTLSKTWENRRFYEANGDEWAAVSGITVAPPIFLEDDVQAELDRVITFFQTKAKWCQERGINHKLMAILHGEQGCGKSRVARYIADRLGYSFGTASVSADKLIKLVRKASEQNIVISVPEVDTLGLADSRGLIVEPNLTKKAAEAAATKEAEEDKDAPKKIVINGPGVPSAAAPASEADAESKVDAMLKTVFGDRRSLGQMLNLFQGDLPINNSVVVMSTNDIAAIDGAMLRGGRCDLVLEVSRMRYKSSNEFFKFYYSTEEDLGDEFKTLAVRACDIMDIFKDNIDNPEQFKKELLAHT